MDSAVAALSEISIVHISEAAKKTYDGLNSPLKRQLQEKFSRPISAKTHEAYRAGTAREYELYHLRLTKNFRIVTRKIEDRYVILAIGNHDDTELFAHNYRGQAPSRIFTLAEAGIVSEEHRKPTPSNALLAPLERLPEEPLRERRTPSHADDELFNATLELASILSKSASIAVQAESSQMRAISDSLRIDFEHKFQALGGEKQQLASRVDALATRVDERARREQAREQSAQEREAEFEKLRDLLDARHVAQESQLATLGETMRHAEGAILEQDQRIDAVQKSAAEFGQEVRGELSESKLRLQHQHEQAAAAAERLESLARVAAERLEAVRLGLGEQQAALARLEAEALSQRSRGESAWAARSRDWEELRQAATARQAQIEQLRSEIAVLPTLVSAHQAAAERETLASLATVRGEMLELKRLFTVAAEEQHNQQRSLTAELRLLRGELAAVAARPWWRRLLG